jgi:hypothetical protein
VNVNHVIVVKKKFEEEVNSPMRGPMKRQLTKKRFNVFDITISNFLGVKNPLKIDDVKQKFGLEQSF